MATVQAETSRSERFWSAVSAALAALARQGGGSLADSPMPELRDTARELEAAGDARHRSPSGIATEN